MRIVFSSDWYSEGMGYSENILPKALAARGHEVFVVTSTLQVYGDHPFYDEVYGRFLGAPIVEAGTKVIDGVTIIRLPIKLWWKRLKVAKGRSRLIQGLKPDIVYAWDPRSYQTVLLSLTSYFSSFKLFTAVHTVASVYPAYYTFNNWPIHRKLYLLLTDTLFGWITNLRTSVCYATTPDAADIACRFFGIHKERIRHLPLGLDTGLFYSRASIADNIERDEIRSALGFQPDELVCIYTGRFTKAKNPHCLAAAIEILRKNGRHFRAFFLGEGEQSELIAAVDGCRLDSFMPYLKLAQIYRAVDIGVWPCQESISMTDAAACGLPIVVSNQMKAVERVEGNGLTYEENNPIDLSKVLASLEDAHLRTKLGSIGAEKMKDKYGIDSMVSILLADFQAASGIK